jgi:inner membrane protein
MSRAGLNRKSALATLTMVLAAEAADLDVLWAIKGPVAALQHHRGITHSFVAVPFVAVVTVGFVFLLSRWRRPSGEPRILRCKLPVRWGYLFWLALLAALSHILLDYTTAYGIRMFAPFNWRWYSWDIVFIIEPVILLALIAGLALPWLFGLINEEIGARDRGPRGRAGAIFALVCLLVRRSMPWAPCSIKIRCRARSRPTRIGSRRFAGTASWRRNRFSKRFR